MREASGLPWSEQNAKSVRQQLDKISVAIKSGTFRFHKVFPNSKKRDYFREKEKRYYGESKSPDQLLFKDYAWIWYGLLKDSGRVSERTLLGYKGYINLYLIPFFGNLTFADLNIVTFDKFISWSRKQLNRGKVVSNESINKYFIPLKTICKNAAVEYGWGTTYNPFFGFKKLPECDPCEHIFPLSTDGQDKLISVMPMHWRPYFFFAFCSGLRQGEQAGLKEKDINFSKRPLQVRRGMTLDENGNRVEEKTKKERTVNLNKDCIYAIKKLLAAKDYNDNDKLFTGQRGPLAVPSISRLVKSWCTSLQTKGNYAAHNTLRKTFGYHQRVTFGVGIAELMECYGHANQKITLKYLCIQPEEIKNIYANRICPHKRH